MATIKAYTDIEQSRKLAEMLPLESADMYYFTIIRNYPYSQGKIKTIAKIMDGSFSSDYDTPCWSLAALFGVLPNDTSLLYFDDAYQMVYDKKPYVISNKFDNPVDACYEVIIKLYELKML